MPGSLGDNLAAGLSILQAASALTSGAVDAVRLTELTFERIRAASDQTVFTCRTEGRAFREATAAALRHREGRVRGLLDGVPVAWKDLFDLSGEVTRAGSRVLDEGPAAADAALVSRLAASGMVTVGKLNMTEFAYSGLGLNPHYGTPNNPWSLDEPRIPGGSSSGSAVAVALGLVPVAIGTDTSGSVRVPAAFNGVIGFKPSSGRWPMAGGFPLSPTLDTAGVLTTSVVDAALIDSAARGHVATDPGLGTLSGLRIIVPTNIVFDDVEPGVLANFEAAIARMANAGVVLERRQLPVLDAVLSLTARLGSLVAIEAFKIHEERLGSGAAARMDRRVVARLEAARSIDPAAEAAIRAARPKMIAEMAPLFDGNTLLAFPTVPHVAPAIAMLEQDDALFTAMNVRTLRNTSLGNFLDWCGVSIPTGLDPAGLPTALLLSGGPDRDGDLLSAALAAEPIVRGNAVLTRPEQLSTR